MLSDGSPFVGKAVGMLGGFFDAGGASVPANEASQARTARRLCAACEHHSRPQHADAGWRLLLSRS